MSEEELRRAMATLVELMLWAQERAKEWAAVDSNHVPPRYQHGALPVELAARGIGRGGRIRTLGPRFWRPML